MLVRQLIEGDVIKGNFGKGHEVNPSVTVPKGYKSFFTKPVGATAHGIFGVKDDGSEHRISTTNSEKLAQMLTKEYNAGGKAGTGLRSMPLIRLLGSEEINHLHDAGIHFLEKPGVWADLERDGKYRPLTDLELKHAKKALEKHGFKLQTYTEHDLWDTKPKGPLSTVRDMPMEECFIVELSNGNRYLVDRTGANSYIRMWRKIGGPVIDDSKLDW